MKFGLFLASAVAVAAFASQASAQVISDSSGQYSVGIGAIGELYDVASGTGFVRVIDGYDPLQPGTPRDSWSIASGLGVAYAETATGRAQAERAALAIAAGDRWRDVKPVDVEQFVPAP